MSFKLILPKNLTPNSGSLSSSYIGNINRLDINNLYNTQVDGRVNGGTKGDIGNIEGDIEDHKINRKGRKAMKKGKGSDNVRNRVEREKLRKKISEFVFSFKSFFGQNLDWILMD